MAAIYAGIDEAGYGPLLGPLTVSMAVFHVEGWQPGDPPVDLWDRLGRAVGRTASDAPARIPIADSKKLKLPNAGARHPLLHLERGVLAMLDWLSDVPPSTDDELLNRIGTRWPDQPWYAGPCEPLPIAGDRTARPLDANMLRAAGAGGGGGRVRPLAIRCAIIDECAFNRTLAEHGSKSIVAQRVVSRFIDEALERWSAPDAPPLRIAVDRQSGRTNYEACLREARPGARIVDAARAENISRYALAGSGLGDAAVRFETEAETRHMPVALASMTAKLVRELAMRRFNRYWSARVPELKPTAGYYADARRWLRDAEAVITEAERTALVRLA